MAIGQELLNVPMGEMIRDMALAIADAQVELDAASMSVAEMMSGTVWALDENGLPVSTSPETGETVPNPRDTRITFGYTVDPDTGDRTPAKISMLELGFSPTFYQFVDTIIEVKIAIKITRSSEYAVTTRTNTEARRWGWQLFKGGNTVQTTQVDASYSSKYGYTAEGSSLLRTKLIPIPPPAILEERIRGMLEAERTRTVTPPTP
jgi:hypothetical protein